MYPICEVIGLSNSSNLQVFGVSILGRLRDYIVFLSAHYDFFKSGPGRTVIFSRCIYTSQYLIESFTVRCMFIFFEDRHKKANTDNLFRY